MSEERVDSQEEREKRIIIVGTAHVSPKSIKDVEETIEREKPQAVAVELCMRRYLALKGEKQDIPVVDIIKRGEAHLLLFQLLLSYFQRKIGEEYGVKPGDEMLAAIKKAEEVGADVLLIDRDIAITFRRFWNSLSFVEKLKIVYNLLKGLFSKDDVDVDEMLKEDVLEVMVKEFRDIAPSAAKTLIDERDAFMAANLIAALKKYDKIVAVVGAGHKKGLERFISNPASIPPIEKLLEVKKGINVMNILGYTIVAFVIMLFIAVIATLNTGIILKAFAYWFLINGILSAIGAAIAGAHPLSILTAFCVAWLTSLNPAIAAGWVSGLVEAWKRSPTSRDIEELSKAESLSQLVRNRVFRILLVAALTNVGSIAGTIIGAWYVMQVTGIDIVEILRENFTHLLQIL
ncbi:TraB family protein [Archaeoglobus veneficus SNP6]|uniref:TraB family protein n=2 Tax=Archaeoglobus veneficus TaxID=58290 RepID=F2KQQ2_ARCVS|nr:TraB family protein [Archaeoglobus veneficus SNP6]